MRKLILCAACLVGIGAMATNNAVKLTQGQTSDVYMLSSKPKVTFDANHHPVLNGKTYNITSNGKLVSTFIDYPVVGEEFDVQYQDGASYYYLKYKVTSVGETNTVQINHNNKNWCPVPFLIPSTVSYKGVTFDVTGLGNNSFIDNTYLREVELPNSITSIGNYAFSGCTCLVSITIPASVISIGNGAFYGATGLKDIYVNWTDAASLPSLGTNIFAQLTPSSINLHVPAGTAAIYQVANVWKEFTIIDPAPVPVDEWATLRTDVTPNDWNTICMERNITAIDGATFWNVVSETEKEFILEQITEPQAGYGYIIRYTATELKVKYGDQVVDAPVEAKDNDLPIQGRFTEITCDQTGYNELVNNYVVYQNKLCMVTGWVTMADHRAYVIAGKAPSEAPAPHGAPRMTMPKPNNTPTSLYQTLDTRHQTQKLLRDGQLVIIRDNKMYTIMGVEE